MRKFNYFLLTAITFIFTTSNLNAFTKTNKVSISVQHVEHLSPLNSECTILVSSTTLPNLEFNEMKVISSNTAGLVTNNLTLLYSICVALVLFNLVAQIKIIVQMIHLFFQFQKKDEFVVYNFQ